MGNDFFCDSVAVVDDWGPTNAYHFYPNSDLWDGQDHLNTCYGLNNPPWFFKTLPVSITDMILSYVCASCMLSGGQILASSYWRYTFCHCEEKKMRKDSYSLIIYIVLPLD